jgi:hypothetical protein
MSWAAADAGSPPPTYPTHTPMRACRRGACCARSRPSVPTPRRAWRRPSWCARARRARRRTRGAPSSPSASATRRTSRGRTRVRPHPPPQFLRGGEGWAQGPVAAGQARGRWAMGTGHHTQSLKLGARPEMFVWLPPAPPPPRERSQASQRATGGAGGLPGAEPQRAHLHGHVCRGAGALFGAAQRGGPDEGGAAAVAAADSGAGWGAAGQPARQPAATGWWWGSLPVHHPVRPLAPPPAPAPAAAAVNHRAQCGARGSLSVGRLFQSIGR